MKTKSDKRSRHVTKRKRVLCVTEGSIVSPVLESRDLAESLSRYVINNKHNTYNTSLFKVDAW